MKRRDFIKLSAGTIASLTLNGCQSYKIKDPRSAAHDELFKISIQQWSFHNRLFAKQYEFMDNLDFPAEARKFGVDAIEFVNTFFKDKATDTKYLAELKKRVKDNGLKSLVIMCDGEGNLGDPDQQKRIKAVENHFKWLEAAKYLGCHSIRVNALSSGNYQEQLKLCKDGLTRLTQYAQQFDLNVIIENHGGLSSDGKWLSKLIRMIHLPNSGTLPDFGNFGKYDRYQSLADIMPFAKSVSAKSYDFDENGNETTIDYERMLRIVLDSGYRGYIGIEYEGKRLGDNDGTLATKKLLERIRDKLTPIYKT